ncbi:MAG: NYN domain-containing protein [Planctomycetes bacterium]|nr:NYN domain-containing protein [Planctomycetota bacterium]
MVVLDAYNFIGQNEDRDIGFAMSRPAASRKKLIALMARFRTLTREKIMLVFDGGEGGAHLPRHQSEQGVDIVFSTPKSSADAEIMEILSEVGGTRNVTVVSSDNDVTRFAKRMGAKVVDCREFWRTVMRAFREHRESIPEEPPEKFEGPSEAEAKLWEHIFGAEDEPRESS